MFTSVRAGKSCSLEAGERSNRRVPSIDDCEQAPSVRYSLELILAAVFELDPRSDNEILDGR